MSRALEPFEDALRAVAARLDVPQPARSRIVLEIAADLTDAYEHCLAQGMDEQDARDAALARFDLSDEAVDELVGVHSTWGRRLMDSLSERGRGRLEKGALVLVLLAAAAMVSGPLAGAGMLEHLGMAAVPSILLTAGALVIAVRKAWRLWATGQHEIRGLHRGLPEILAAAIAGLAFGMAGYWVEIYRTFAAASAAGSSTPALLLFADGLLRALATGIVAMTGAVFICLIWWLLARKVARIERAEIEALMEI